jgi:hypothetical protein
MNCDASMKDVRIGGIYYHAFSVEVFRVSDLNNFRVIKLGLLWACTHEEQEDDCYCHGWRTK